MQTFGIQDLGLKMENTRNVFPWWGTPLGLFPFGTVTGYRHDFVLSVIVSWLDVITNFT